MSNANLTIAAIQRTYIELLGEKAPGKITVKEISERCGINRNTFYYHYQDVLELLEDICERDFDSVVEQYPELNSLEECFDAIIEVMKSKKSAIMNIYRSDNSHVYTDVLWKMCEHVVKKYLSTVFPDAPLSDKDKQLVIRYFKCSCFGLMIDWINSGMNDDYIENMHRVLKMSKGAADLIIGNCSADQHHFRKDPR